MAYLNILEPLFMLCRRMAKRLAFALAFLFAATPVIAAPPLEQAIKASYLFKFGPFVDWPADAFASASAPFQICIAGQDPFGSVLDDIVRGQRIHGRAIVVRRIKDGSARNCQILFLGKPTIPGGKTLPDGIDAPVLTVSDRENMTGGMIEFVLQHGRVRFRINDSSARASRLRISSKLLALALDRK